MFVRIFIILISFASSPFSQKVHDDLKDIENSQTYFSADTVRTFQGKFLFRARKTYVVNFVPRQNENEVIKGVELKLYWQPEDFINFSHLKVVVYELKKGKKSAPLDFKFIKFDQKGNYNFELTGIQIENAKNKTFLVQISPISTQEDFEINGKITQATLIVYTKTEGLRKRPKREAKRPRGNRKRLKNKKKVEFRTLKKEPCQLVKHDLVFDHIGWNWILAPSNFSMNLCVGHCSGLPLPAHLNPSNHAVMQNHYHSILPNKIPPPCCIPIEYDHVSILMIVKKSESTESLKENAFRPPSDEDTDVEMKDVPFMTATKCGCR